ncbi:hypothetical protein MTO96_020062 [Rhipicephalus appendiculatus]
MNVLVGLAELLLQEVLFVFGRAVKLVRAVHAVVDAVLAVPVVTVHALVVRLLDAVILHEELRRVVRSHGLTVGEHTLPNPVGAARLAFLEFAALLPREFIVGFPLAFFGLPTTVLPFLSTARVGTDELLRTTFVLLALLLVNIEVLRQVNRWSNGLGNTSGRGLVSGCRLLAVWRPSAPQRQGLRKAFALRP